MSERPLPWFQAGQDPGSSFADLLARTAPAGTAAGPAPLASGTTEVPHGTTVLAIRFADGVVMAGDRRATSGMQISGRRMEKVQAADAFSGVAIAGAAGPAMELVRLFQTEVEHYEKVEGDALTLDGKANRLSQMIRSNLPAAMQGFVVIPLFAGYDRDRGQGRLFQYDVTGGRYEEIDYHSTGSGGIHAKNWIKAHWSEGLERDAAVDLAVASIVQAADEDAATAGADLIRSIYPSVAVIDADGFSMLDDDEVGRRTRSAIQAMAPGETPPDDDA